MRYFTMKIVKILPIRWDFIIYGVCVAHGKELLGTGIFIDLRKALHTHDAGSRLRGP